MDLRQLSALLAVDDHGSFSAAARALFTVQSNVSAHIRRLEAEVGAELIDRQRGTLTEEGRLVARRARRIMAELESVPNDLVATRGPVAGELRIGSIGTTGRWLLPQLLPQIRERHPGIELSILEASTTNLAADVADGRIELAMLNLPLPNIDLQASLLFEEDLMLLVSVDHPLNRHDSVSIADVAPFEVLMPPAGTALRSDIDEAARRARVTLRPYAEIDGGRLLTSLALEALAIAVIPATAVSAGGLPESIAQVPLTGLPRRRVGLATRRRSALSAPARAFVATLQEVLAETAPLQTGVHLHAAEVPDAQDDDDSADRSPEGH